jgi:hypothetical protein
MEGILERKINDFDDLILRRENQIAAGGYFAQIPRLIPSGDFSSPTSKHYCGFYLLE